MNSGDPTTEAKRDENVAILENEAPFKVAANPAVNAPLDKRDMDKRDMQPLPRRGQNKSAQGNALPTSAEPRIAQARTCRLGRLRPPTPRPHAEAFSRLNSLSSSDRDRREPH